MSNEELLAQVEQVQSWMQTYFRFEKAARLNVECYSSSRFRMREAAESLFPELERRGEHYHPLNLAVSSDWSGVLGLQARLTLWIEASVYLRSLAARLRNDAAAADERAEGKGKGKRPKTIDERMQEIMIDDPLASGWPIRGWAKRLGKCTSAIQKTETWQTIMNTREGARLARAMKQDGGRRRSR
jgi:hypothetical protein